MKSYSLFFLIALMSLFLVAACGPSEEERQQQEQARQDSLENVRRQQMEQQRQDSLANVRARSEAEHTADNENNYTFSKTGPYALQVESWRSEAKARSRVSTWKERGFNNAEVVKYGDEAVGDIWFRVRLGHLESQDQARQAQEKLKEEYQEDSWIVASN